ncbi:hypothetical protein CL656_02705 [bacterium]|nr:hypothetical protein [bacterium]|tara:strand:+ start:2699 stop:4087 length:1389 start_codon:yes stop_codon:yes gene_type:complete
MLTVKNLTIQINKQTLFKDFNLSLDSKSKKKIALLGKNGSGKSCLVKSITGEFENFSGQINIQNETICYFKQEYNFSNHQLVGEYLENLLEYDYEYYKIEQILETLKLNEEITLKTFSELSEGQKIKIRLGEILLQEPSILILDEPTNHLDQESIDFYENFIQEFPGSILLITHNTQLLRNCINKIYEINNQTQNIDFYDGNFDYWWNQRTHRIQTQKKDLKQLQKQKKEIQNWLKANEFHPKYRFSSYVGAQKKQLEKLNIEISNIQIIKDTDLKISSRDNLKEKSKLLYQEIFKEQKIQIRKNQITQIKGPNGIGKTYLLNQIFQEFTSNKDLLKEGYKIGILEQISSFKEDSKLDKYLNSNHLLEKQKTYQLIDQLDLKRLLKNKLSELSGGEKKRIKLLELIASNPNIILLDEPTNHLDIYSQISLIEWINNHNKTVIYVSHDKNFYNYIQNDHEINL